MKPITIPASVILTSAAILVAAFTLFVLFFIFALDDWLGILAYTYRYIGFSILFAATVAGACRMISKKAAFIGSVAAFALLMLPFAVKAPSARILREVMIHVLPGTTDSEAEAIVQQAYRNSGYTMPMITKGSDRIHVSLMSQRDGECTAVIFQTQDGLVVRSRFSAD